MKCRLYQFYLLKLASLTCSQQPLIFTSQCISFSFAEGIALFSLLLLTYIKEITFYQYNQPKDQGR